MWICVSTSSSRSANEPHPSMGKTSEFSFFFNLFPFISKYWQSPNWNWKQKPGSQTHLVSFCSRQRCKIMPRLINFMRCLGVQFLIALQHSSLGAFTATPFIFQMSSFLNTRVQAIIFSTNFPFKILSFNYFQRKHENENQNEKECQTKSVCQQSSWFVNFYRKINEHVVNTFWNLLKRNDEVFSRAIVICFDANHSTEIFIRWKK